jgi:hypothetical protein
MAACSDCGSSCSAYDSNSTAVDTAPQAVEPEMQQKLEAVSTCKQKADRLRYKWSLHQ